MIPILKLGVDDAAIAALQEKLSLRPLLLEGLADEDSPTTAGGNAFAAVRRIVRAVRDRGDAAVLEFTQQFDRVTLTAETLRVTPAQIAATAASISPELNAAFDVAINNIRRYQQAMLAPTPAALCLPGGGYVGLQYTPLERVGLYVPGGAAAYPSSVLHTAIPAQVAGVKQLVLCSPLRHGTIAPTVLAAAHKLGITEIYGIGGAQAVAALAFGTPTIRKVDKIVGPGNSYVQLAKKELFGLVDIDSFAGPSEVIVLADATADARMVAAELLAQAEHAPGSCLLITADAALASAVQREMDVQLEALSRAVITRTALTFASALIVAPDHAAALTLVNAFAPEHLQITTADSAGDAAKIINAGAIFIGSATPVAAGDYLAGPSHVLPTSGTGRFFSGLSAESFRKRTSMVHFAPETLAALGPAIETFAHAEGFDAHAASVAKRLP